MKKSRLLLKPALVFLAVIAMYSCVSQTEAPVIQEEASQIEALNNPASNEENLRKTPERNYFERFDNSLFMVPGEGYNEGPDNAYYPGTGTGNSAHMGKALSFLNQFAQFGENGLETVGKPVTMYFGTELSNLGLTSIPDEVSSLTTDGKGNSVWFKAIKNSVTFIAIDRANFKAEVEIIGGTGKFVGASGSGEVVGFFNPADGKGSSTIKGRIEY